MSFLLFTLKALTNYIRWITEQAVRTSREEKTNCSKFCNETKKQHLSLSFIICNYEFFKKAIWLKRCTPLSSKIVRKIGKIFQMVGHMTITTEWQKPPITRRWIQARMRWSIWVTLYPTMANVIVTWSQARQPMKSFLVKLNHISKFYLYYVLKFK